MKSVFTVLSLEFIKYKTKFTSFVSWIGILKEKIRIFKKYSRSFSVRN